MSNLDWSEYVDPNEGYDTNKIQLGIKANGEPSRNVSVGDLAVFHDGVFVVCMEDGKIGFKPMPYAFRMHQVMNGVIRGNSHFTHFEEA